MNERNWTGPLEKVDDYRWRIPESFSRGMRVPGIVFSDEKLLRDIRTDQSLQQVVNVAHLPGIVKASMAMPDIHWGYGAPIGGVAAMDPADEGVISPGVVGYDINCVTGDAEILHGHGYTLPIEALKTRWNNQEIQALAQVTRRLEAAALSRFITSPQQQKVFLLATMTGRQIKATADHPFLTPTGMRLLKDLQKGENVAVVPCGGVPYEPPPTMPIVTLKRVQRMLDRLGRSTNQGSGSIIVEKLRARGLLAFTYEHPKVPLLLKIMGMIFGDGSMNFIGARGDGIVSFCGRAHDLEMMRRDISELGYTAGPLHWKITHLLYKGRIRSYRNASFIVNASSLVVLLASLGVPVGRKVTQPYRVPLWVRRAPRWQQRLFLAALFGAELTKPRPRPTRRGNFCAPALSMNKAENLLANGVAFLEDIQRMVKRFDVTTADIVVTRRHLSRQGVSTRYLELVFDPNPENLLHLWGQIGFEYHREKAALASLAVHYLRLKRQALDARQAAIGRIQALHQAGNTHTQVHAAVGSHFITKRYVQSVAQRERQVPPRIPNTFPAYKVFAQLATIGLEGSGVVWDAVESITLLDGLHTVYDVTVQHPDHNFVANGFVVHNCGVRLVRTDLTVDEVQPKLRTLISSLFNDIPCGVGMSGEIRVGKKDADRLMVQGSRWVVSKGYGSADDLAHTESQGCLEGADPSKVSDRALQRGHDQLGTLGSGNHFLEVQAVETVYDEHGANLLGLFPDQVTVMIHSGSRGFGYQICDDYLDLTARAMAAYGIRVPDRQLACAPLDSDEGRAYLGAMRCAANYAWSNRQCLMHLGRQTFERVFGKSWEQLGMQLVYDVAHNIAKFERHRVDGRERLLCVHRKGATRAFPPGHPEVPEDYRDIGQPVIIPGDMGRNSYVLVGTEQAMTESFGSCCHGAGRVMSRSEAVRKAAGRSIEQELERQGIIVMGRGRKGVAEEQPGAYKDVNDVVDVVHKAGLAKRVVRLRPLGVIKG